jgi:hypothetical protein
MNVTRKELDLVAALHRAIPERGQGHLVIIRLTQSGQAITSRPLQLGETEAYDVVRDLAAYIKGQDEELELLHAQAADWSNMHDATAALASERMCRLDAYERLAGRLRSGSTPARALEILERDLARIDGARSPLRIEADELPPPLPTPAVGERLPRLVPVPKDPK